MFQTFDALYSLVTILKDFYDKWPKDWASRKNNPRAPGPLEHVYETILKDPLVPLIQNVELEEKRRIYNFFKR